MARPRSNSARVLGPIYIPPKHGRGVARWRVTVVGQDGGRRSRNFRVEEDAKEYKARWDKKLGTLQGATVEFAIVAFKRRYLMEQEGWEESSVVREEYYLYSFFGPVLKSRIALLTAKRCKELYLGKYDENHERIEDGVIQRHTRFGKKPSVATHHNTLAAAQLFLEWCSDPEQGYFKESPAANIEKVDTAPAGKTQLKTEHGKKFLMCCWRAAEGGNAAGVVGLLAIIVGMRATEIATLTPNHIDMNGTVVRVLRGKTKKSIRDLSVAPEYEVGHALSGFLLALMEGKAIDEPIFGYSNQGNPRNRDWVYDRVHEMCKLAGVPLVSPHGLRGTQATGAEAAGATAEAQLKNLGHTARAVGLRSYIQAGATERGQQRRFLAKLQLADGGRSNEAKGAPAPVVWKTSQRRSWSPEQKQQIIQEYDGAPAGQRAGILVKHGVVADEGAAGTTGSSLIYRWKQSAVGRR